MARATRQNGGRTFLSARRAGKPALLSPVTLRRGLRAIAIASAPAASQLAATGSGTTASIAVFAVWEYDHEKPGSSVGRFIASNAPERRPPRMKANAEPGCGLNRLISETFNVPSTAPIPVKFSWSNSVPALTPPSSMRSVVVRAEPIPCAALDPARAARIPCQELRVAAGWAQQQQPGDEHCQAGCFHHSWGVSVGASRGHNATTSQHRMNDATKIRRQPALSMQ